MILELFSVLTVLSIILFTVGYYFKMQYMRIIGFGLLAIVGLNTMGGIEYNTGSFEDTNYVYDNGTLITSENTITKTYDNWDNKNFGYFFIIFGSFGIIIDLIFSWDRKEDYGGAYI